MDNDELDKATELTGVKLTLTPQPRQLAQEAILAEREYQEKRWANENSQHTKEEWATIIAVYSGKISVETKPYTADGDNKAYLRRIAQMGAICLAAYEAVLLRELNKPKASSEESK